MDFAFSSNLSISRVTPMKIKEAQVIKHWINTLYIISSEEDEK